MQERVERQSPQTAFHGLPVIPVQRGLLVHGTAHEHVVAHQVRCLEVQAGGVHRFEHQLRLVAPLVQGDGHYLEPLQAVPHHVRVADRADPSAEQVQVPFQIRIRATGHGTPGIDEPVGQIPQHGAVVAGQRQLVAGVAVRILVDQIAAVDDHVSGEAQAVRMPSRVLGQRDEQQAHRGEALLAVDQQAQAAAVRADAAVLHPHDRTGEMRAVRMPARRDDVSPQLAALRLAHE